MFFFVILCGFVCRFVVVCLFVVVVCLFLCFIIITFLFVFFFGVFFFVLVFLVFFLQNTPFAYLRYKMPNLKVLLLKRHKDKFRHFYHSTNMTFSLQGVSARSVVG